MRSSASPALLACGSDLRRDGAGVPVPGGVVRSARIWWSKSTKGVNPGRIVLWDGTRIETKSGVDHRTLSKESPDGIIGCEASQLDATVFSRMRGRVTARNGWLFLAGTFESSVGWYPQLFKAWQQGGPQTGGASRCLRGRTARSIREEGTTRSWQRCRRTRRTISSWSA